MQFVEKLNNEIFKLRKFSLGNNFIHEKQCLVLPHKVYSEEEHREYSLNLKTVHGLFLWRKHSDFVFKNMSTSINSLLD